MATHGTVEYWELVVKHRDGTASSERYRSWDIATYHYHEAVKASPLSAEVRAVQSGTYGKGFIKTWDYHAPNSTPA